MTIKELWDRFLEVDIIAFFEVFVPAFGSALVIILMVIGGLVWWLHGQSQ